MNKMLAAGAFLLAFTSLPALAGNPQEAAQLAGHYVLSLIHI